MWGLWRNNRKKMFVEVVIAAVAGIWIVALIKLLLATRENKEND